MKRELYILLAILLLAGLPASAQMKRGGQKKEVPKTEKTTSKKQKKQLGSSGKSTRPPKPGNVTNSDAEQKRKQEEAAKQRAEEEQRRQQEETERQRIIQQAIDDMVWVEGGTFTMGGIAAYNGETPTHQVTLSGYYIGKYEVTQKLWKAVMGSNPSWNLGDSRRPVETVSWDDCQEFISKLNLLTGKQFRLPTEAEWEFAARGGNKSSGYKYAGSNSLNDVAWYDENSGDTTHPVGQKSPNELGLYDMSGNVQEWCQDWYGSYDSAPQTNPTGPSSGDCRILRGGSYWKTGYGHCPVSSRNRYYPNSTTYSSIGLRLALSSSTGNQRAVLGIQYKELSDQLAKENNITVTNKGLFVAIVNDGGAAKKAGIQEGDVIVKFNGASVNNSVKLNEEMRKMQPGDRAEIELYRGNKLQHITVKLKGLE